jgi:hypothetical protein
MKVQRINFNEFMSGEYQLKVKKIKEIRKGRVYKVILVGGLTLVMLHTGLGSTAFAAGTGIDVGAYQIYKKLLLIGKWIIIVKGGIDTINAMVQGDHPAAKRGFLTYLVVYLILNGLPWAMGEIDTLFKEMQDIPTGGVAE